MKSITILFFGLLLNSLLYAADSDTIKADNSFIEYTGRIDFSNPLAPMFSYSGVSVRGYFQGTSISFILNDAGSRNYYNVLLDNTVVSRLQTKSGLNSYSIASGLKDTIHEIEIFRLTEETFGKTQFLGFIVDKGKTLVQISGTRNLLFEFIGNSITCGYGNEGINGQGSFGPTTENHYLTYAAITSRSFNARHLAVCKSGIGIYRNYDGLVTGSPDCMTNYYSRTFLYDAFPLYGFKDKPDLICIDLGTNDFSTNKGDPDKYKTMYLQFIDSIQLKNKGADILCLLGPMLSGSILTDVRNYLHYIVDSANSKNAGKVYFFEMSQQTGSLGLGIDYHPTVAQHLKNARELVNFINTIKRWLVIPKAIFGTIGMADEIILNFNTELYDTSNDFDGFSVSAGNVNVPVSSAGTDPADRSKINLHLSESLPSGQKVTVSYSPGSVTGKDTVKLEKMTSFSIPNQLTETRLIKAAVDNTGSKVTLTFNKKILGPADLQGILIYDSGNTVLLANTFKKGSSSLDIFLNSKVSSGNSLFITITARIYGADKVAVTPVSGYIITNNSIYTQVEENHIQGLYIYPNPLVNKVMNYRIDGSNPGKIIARLFNLQGKLIFSKELYQQTGMIDFNNSQVPCGSYVLKCNIFLKEYSTLVIL